MLKRLSQLSAVQIFGLTFGIWALGLFLISNLPILQNTGYLAFQLWELVSPTLITLFLYIRSIRSEQSTSKKFQLHVAWLVTLAVVISLGIKACVGNPNGSDLVQGLRWDFYQFSALLLGSAAFWICYGITDRFRTARNRSGPCAPPNGGPAAPLGNSGVTEGPPSVSSGR